MKKSIVIICVVFFALVACQKPVEYPVEPQIAYTGFTYLFNVDSTFSGEGIIPDFDILESTNL
jgi:hypothetical protein